MSVIKVKPHLSSYRNSDGIPICTLKPSADDDLWICSLSLSSQQIAALAHDLKTPLTVIQGNIDLINETELDGEQRLYAGYITESSEQIGLYIKALIDISRAAAGYQLH